MPGALQVALQEALHLALHFLASFRAMVCLAVEECVEGSDSDHQTDQKGILTA